ncbi:MAG: hypothetical protein JXQ87_05610 [Bacteroidia bacterium]
MFKKLSVALIALVGIISFSSCYKYESYYTEIKVVTDGLSRKIVLASEGADDLSTYGYGGFYPSTVYTSGNKGDTLNVLIDWSDDYYAWLNPRLEDLYFYHFFQGQFVTETEKVSEAFKLKPGIKYIFDLNTGKVTNTGERSERLNTGNGFNFGSGDCGDEIGSWSLKTYDGKSLPANVDGVNEITSGSVSFASNGNWSGINKVTGNGQDFTNTPSGSYSCQNGEIEILNENNTYTATATIRGTTLTWNDAGGYVLVFEK